MSWCDRGGNAREWEHQGGEGGKGKGKRFLESEIISKKCRMFLFSATTNNPNKPIKSMFELCLISSSPIFLPPSSSHLIIIIVAAVAVAVALSFVVVVVVVVPWSLIMVHACACCLSR
jgi:hypothetical protein